MDGICADSLIRKLVNFETMKVLVDIQDDKAVHVLEVLNSISYIKTQTLTAAKAQVFSELSDAVNELKQVKAGQLKARPLKELLDELSC